MFDKNNQIQKYYLITVGACDPTLSLVQLHNLCIMLFVNIIKFY